MTKAELKPILMKIATLYSGKFGVYDDERNSKVLTAEFCDIWLEALKDEDAGAIGKGLDKWIKRSPFPPTVADLIECGKEFVFRFDYDGTYSNVRFNYPKDVTSLRAYELYCEFIDLYPNEYKYQAAESLKQRVQTVDEATAPEWEEWMQTVVDNAKKSKAEYERSMTNDSKG